VTGAPDPTAEPPVPAAAREFDSFYAATCGDVVAMLYPLTGNLADAQDLAQEAFCRAWQRWSVLSGYDEPVGWVKRVAARLAIDTFRRWGTARRFLAGHRPEVVPPISTDHVALVAALRRLPHRVMHAVVLHYLADLPVAAVADELGVTANATKLLLLRGRRALAEHLADRPTERGGDLA
jgi:RNA polymerase sigma-70 factor (ECF subfamily)